MDQSVKILLLGKTGVGKSAFINYFLGKKVADSAPGKPVTQDYFTSYKLESENHSFEIFDTKGLEAKNTEEQLEKIICGIKERNNSNNIFNWFHTIFYCVSMGNPRFEAFEAKFIRRLQKELTQHIYIILTNCDTCSEETIANMIDRINVCVTEADCNLEIFPVVSVSTKKRNGTVTQPRGREAILNRVLELLWEDIAYKLSCKYAKSLRTALLNAANSYILRTESNIDKMFSIKAIVNSCNNTTLSMDIAEELDNAKIITNNEFNQILHQVLDFHASYKNSVMDGSTLKDAKLDYDSWYGVDLIDFMFLNPNREEFQIFPGLQQKGYMDEYGLFTDMDASLSNIAKMTVTALGDILRSKRNLKKYYRHIYDQYLHYLPSESDLQQNSYKRILELVRPASEIGT